jgi:TonB family protein
VDTVRAEIPRETAAVNVSQAASLRPGSDAPGAAGTVATNPGDGSSARAAQAATTAPANLIHKVQPIYPAAARGTGAHGAVILTARIGRDGKVLDVRVVKGDDLLAKAAVDAVREWQYQPYLWKGVPTEVDTEIVVNFAEPETKR